MTDETLPSGEQTTITYDDQTAVVVEVGGGVRTYRIGDRDVLDGYDADAMADGARCQSLVPWPNRVQDGRWSWRGEERQLNITEPEQHNAIHGLLRWMPWRVVASDAASVTLAVTSHPQPGYPWTLDVTNAWSLGAAGLSVTTTITNRSADPAPVAAGFHPYLTVGTPTVDTATLHVPADTWLPTGDQQIPTGREPVAGTPYDFRSPRPIGDVEIDYTFTDLHRDDDGAARLRLSAPDGTVATLWLDPAYDYLEVFTGDALPDKSRRRRGLGVEPMSAPPNAMATGESLVVLDPGQSWTGRWGIDPR